MEELIFKSGKFKDNNIIPFGLPKDKISTDGISIL